jgi:SHS2 domain-containing protein
MEQPSGFREVSHIADWEIEVWAPDLAALFEQAALGMYALSGTNLYPDPRITRNIELVADDTESLLVKFLTELLFQGEQFGLAFDGFDLQVVDSQDNAHLRAKLHGAPMTEQTKEIKAVTYHNLAIQSSQRGLVVRIVFDV